MSYFNSLGVLGLNDDEWERSYKEVREKNLLLIKRNNMFFEKLSPEVKCELRRYKMCVAFIRISSLLLEIDVLCKILLDQSPVLVIAGVKHMKSIARMLSDLDAIRISSEEFSDEDFGALGRFLKVQI